MHTRGTKLRDALAGGRVSCLLEAHDALSARIVGEAGLDGVWASSLTLSAAAGVPDRGTLSMAEALGALEAMIEATDLPVLFDGDHGYGDFHHVQRLVRRIGARGAAGLAIEDKAFPKKNSFLGSEQQELAAVPEFVGKLRAAKDAQTDPSFVVVARTEALVVGLGVGAALERAERYVEAGADAVLVHSKAKTFAEIQDFMRQWGGRAPVVCVPTSYYATPPEAFAAAGVAAIIWANHLLRAAILAMQRTARAIAATRSARTIEDDVAPLAEVFRLQGEDAFAAHERAYGPDAEGRRAVVLAASRGEGLDELTRERPKAMIPVGGEPVVERLLRQLRAEGVKEVGVVRGYAKEALAPAGVRLFDNARWAETGEVASLAAASEMLSGDVIVAYGDVVVKRYLVHELAASDAAITLVVDGSPAALARRGGPAPRDRVRASAPPRAPHDDRPVFLERMGVDVPEDEAHGVWVGLARVRGEGATELRAALHDLAATSSRAELSALWNRLAARGPRAVRVLYVQGDWVDVNSLEDVARAQGGE